MTDVMVIPAIDLKDGKCVRLRQGLADAVTVYSEDPVQMAVNWERQGATYLHVVDLDGAFQGHPVHDEVIERMASTISIPIETGGGLRTDHDINRLLSCGVDRVIIGTRALAEPRTLQALVDSYGPRLAVGIDARDGLVQVKGWTETTEQGAVDLAKSMDAMGVQTIIYTDTARDGMLEGVNAEAMGAMCEAVSCSVIASGGVSRVEDLCRLRALERDNLIGAIVGKALYDGKVELKDLLAK